MIVAEEKVIEKKDETILDRVDYKNLGGRPPILKSSNQVYTIATQYFKQCEQFKKPITVSGLALCLGMDTRSLRNYASGVQQTVDRDVFSAIRDCYSVCERYAEEMLFNKEVRPTGAIFALKNMGWRDQKDITVSKNWTYDVPYDIPEADVVREEDDKKSDVTQCND